jgi:hypothetical protein
MRAVWWQRFRAPPSLAAWQRRWLCQGAAADEYGDRFWLERLQDTVTRPSAVGLMQKLHPTQPLGVDASVKGVRKGRLGLFSFFMDVKRKHPRKVALVRVGDFYECFGYDAVVLVE